MTNSNYFSIIKNYATISLGSNLGNSIQNLKEGLRLLDQNQQIEVIRKSKFYSSEAWGFKSINQFVNSCCVINTNLTPGGLLLALQRIEKALGRELKTKQGYQDRAIDLDIVFYNNLVLRSKTLVIPHKFMHVRNFVLEPLTEISPNWVHPLYLKSVAELLAESLDSSQVYAL